MHIIYVFLLALGYFTLTLTLTKEEFPLGHLTDLDINMIGDRDIDLTLLWICAMSFFKGFC